MLFLQVVPAAASRTFWTAGRSNPMRIAMMAMTTSSSISVKAAWRPRVAEQDMLDLRSDRPVASGRGGGEPRAVADRSRVTGACRRDETNKYRAVRAVGRVEGGAERRRAS